MNVLHVPGCISGWLRIKRLNDGGIFLCVSAQCARPSKSIKCRETHIKGALSLFTCVSCLPTALSVSKKVEGFFSLLKEPNHNRTRFAARLLVAWDCVAAK